MGNWREGSRYSRCRITKVKCQHTSVVYLQITNAWWGSCLHTTLGMLGLLTGRLQMSVLIAHLWESGNCPAPVPQSLFWGRVMSPLVVIWEGTPMFTTTVLSVYLQPPNAWDAWARCWESVKCSRIFAWECPTGTKQMVWESHTVSHNRMRLYCLHT